MPSATSLLVRRGAAVAAAFGLVTVAGPQVADAAPAATATGPAAPHWSTCPAGSEAPRGTYCTTLKVPLDYARPRGRQIKLTLSVAGDANAPRTLVVNPGGPGEPGIGTAQLVWSQLPADVSAKYNVVSFDPRGVGASTPVSCGDTRRLIKHPAGPYTPTTDAQEQARRTVARKVAEQCYAKAKDLLPYITTENAARDMDRIRAALGRDKMDYLGYSYGTRLGATYATLFPSHTGRMILDSVVDPTVTTYASQYEQDPALQHRAEQFFAWVAKKDETYHLGTSAAKVSATWDAVRKKLDAHPAGGRAGSAELDDLLASGMYTDLEWADVAQPVADYRRGDASALVGTTDQLALGSVVPARLAYNCVDDAWPRDWATWHRETAAAAPKSPLFAWLNSWYSAPCAFWKAPTARPVKIGSAHVPPVLLLQAKDDAATPVVGARRMHQALTGSGLVVAGGGNHGQYLFDGNACMDRHGSRYLLTGRLPAEGATCPAAPAP
ncbi:alpha/beta hydrolase [Streptomyces olivochromogenes]|uniref:alpha/beta hydrolase n=1 Tax=Streptomyces olivochromogenes TaxID=1963 RepID=UPI001F3161DC|nr:alpha/beta hydrolase [Streptomyces olivochromogenes]MCF3131125.1 alpha/beta fold hydrolase [Streptomyces olivochromogenes]